MTAFTAPGNEQSFQEWLNAQGFSENPFAPDGWNDLALHALLRHRLSYCNHAHTSQWEELFQAEANNNSLAQLLAVAQGSPQRLLRLCDALLRHLAAQGADTITATAVSAVIAEQQALDDTPTIHSTSAPPDAGLFMDRESGHVWIDQQQLLPPLTEQEFTLLRTLYSHAPEIVDCETLIHNIWPEDHSLVGDEQNLRKLISRLRHRLEPYKCDNDWRFIRSMRGRGYWLHRDAEEL
ncbi:MAG: winged helix-turn-helix transcriptional regulator [Anaerolineae bacterium]|nr:winged helix-turn-helix transcriptional regulator [Anaerolineae bacterium]